MQSYRPPSFFSLTLKWSVKTEKILGYFLIDIASGQLISLQILDLENGYKTPLPNNIGQLIYLLYLNLRRTLIKEIPQSFFNLKNLQILDLRHTFIPTFHIPIQKLQKLKNLYLDPQIQFVTEISDISFKNLQSLININRLPQNHWHYIFLLGRTPRPPTTPPKPRWYGN